MENKNKRCEVMRAVKMSILVLPDRNAVWELAATLLSNAGVHTTCNPGHQH
jgi:hypothetical protein